jgi:hypothetical protein
MRKLFVVLVIVAMVLASGQTVKILGKKVTPGAPDIAFVQSATNGAGCDAGSSSTVAATFGSNITAASGIVVLYSIDSDPDATNCSAATVADTRSNSYTVAVSVNNATNNQCIGIAYAVNSSAGANTVTVTFPTADVSRTIAVLEYSNVKTSAASDGTNSAYNAAVSTWLSGSITTTVNGDLVVGGTQCSSSSSTSHAPGSGFTERVDLWTCRVAAVEQIQTSAGSIEASGTLTGGAGNCLGAALALKKQ